MCFIVFYLALFLLRSLLPVLGYCSAKAMSFLCIFYIYTFCFQQFFYSASTCIWFSLYFFFLGFIVLLEFVIWYLLHYWKILSHFLFKYHLPILLAPVSFCPLVAPFFCVSDGSYTPTQVSILLSLCALTWILSSDIYFNSFSIVSHSLLNPPICDYFLCSF